MNNSVKIKDGGEETYSLRPKLFGLIRKIQLFKETSLTALSLLKKKLKIS